MPPEGDPLSTSEIDLIRRWIDAGALWPDALANEEASRRDHWAFIRPARPEVPQTTDDSWARNEIDRFVRAKLDEERLAPSSPADRVTLIRRLSFDLIGLPPTIEAVDAFVNDSSTDAYDQLVERLLASPHYGERWGRIWLDAARYADSDGYEKDKSRQVWAYRDWVVSALNRDLPYDQFIVEQIAGDLLPDATQDQRVATGFLRNSMINEEGGIDPEQFRMEAMFDRMDAIGKSILGVTIQCAQCHNHKFDPLTQAEYYGMFAFLNNDHEANIAVYAPAERAIRAHIFQGIREIEEELKHNLPDWRERMAHWENEVHDDQPAWTVIQPAVDDESNGGQKYLPLQDGSFLAQGYAPTKHTVKLTIDVEQENIAAIQLELLTDPNLPLGGPGRSIKGTCALTQIEVEAAPLSARDKSEKIKIASATADVNPAEAPLDKIFDDNSGKHRVTGPVSFAIDDNDLTAWGMDVGPGRRNQPRKAVFKLEKTISNPGGTLLTIRLAQNHGGWNSDDNQNHNLGRFRLSISADENATADPVPADVRKIFDVPAEDRTPEQIDTVFSYWRTTRPEWHEANAAIDELWKTHPEGSSQLAFIARETPRTTHVLQRGDFLKPDRQVGPGVPSFLHPLPTTSDANRLTFARWLVDPASPTTARSIVNRVWQTYFGLGFVMSSEDLGTQCEPPSHPQLLDWLAVEFMDRGWRLKDLHRWIVKSATYRQSSAIGDGLLARDPYNRLLARGPRFRVDAEIVRDAFLAASGLLNPTLGGRSVFPPVPEFMLQPPVSYGPKVWYTETGPDRYRRAIYTFRYRSVPFPSLQTFDAPNGDFSCTRRARSNTPLQALVTLNEPIFVECAQSLGRRTLLEGGQTDSDRITYAFRRCLARAPTPAEAKVLSDFLEMQRSVLAEEPENARAIIEADLPGGPPCPSGVEAHEIAAWTLVARVILNLDETITKE
jgi:hypothetical protein